ncbi:hypothetical protein NUW58_g4249 [Xylaria curta]|uniref:Uncharacterized protein n=1 Tax=Xylaria curta TaxID=42375 RepID=A0ACC1P765_9PEZI|nr:hypothetical protein NUW58_g4249 [Xylaria curta]
MFGGTTFTALTKLPATLAAQPTSLAGVVKTFKISEIRLPLPIVNIVEGRLVDGEEIVDDKPEEDSEIVVDGSTEDSVIVEDESVNDEEVVGNGSEEESGTVVDGASEGEVAIDDEIVSEEKLVNEAEFPVDKGVLVDEGTTVVDRPVLEFDEIALTVVRGNGVLEVPMLDPDEIVVLVFRSERGVGNPGSP